MLRLWSTETIGLGAVGAELVMMFALELDEWLTSRLIERAHRVRVGTNGKSARGPRSSRLEDATAAGIALQGSLGLRLSSS